MKQVDLTIADISKSAADSLHPDMTAANFGNLAEDASPADLAAGVVNLVLQAIGTMTVLACQSCGADTVVVIGSMTTLTQAEANFQLFEKLYGIHYIIPENATFATAIGAGLCSLRQKGGGVMEGPGLWPIYHPRIPPLLRHLATTAPVERLRQVGMNCGCEYTDFPRFRGLAPYSRFRHSVGVGLIVWHFTHDNAQAAAGLLHDVSTPVFAHVVDFLNGDHLTQTSTESGTAALIAGDPGIRRVLAAHGLTPAMVADYHRYPIADNDSPRLSADRLEYTLGNAVNYGFITVGTGPVLLPGPDGGPQ